MKNIKVSDEVHEALKAEARRTGVKIYVLIERAVKRLIKPSK